MQSVTPYFVFPHNVATHSAYLSTITSHFIIHTVTAHSVIHSPSLHTSSFTHHEWSITAHFFIHVELRHTSSFHSQSLHNLFIDSVTTHSVYSLTVTTHFLYLSCPLTFTSGCSPAFIPVYTLISSPFRTINSLHSTCVCMCLCVCVCCVYWM